MEYQEISNKVQEAFKQMNGNHNGQIFNGTFEVNNFAPGNSIRLNSSVYTERLDSESYIPDMPEPYDGCQRHPIPEGIFFRVEIAKKPGDSEHFLASMCEGTGIEYSFIAHIKTNDTEYVGSHPYIKWDNKNIV